MPRHASSEGRIGPRYLAALPVQVEWETSEGTRIVAEGTTENVGPEGALVHLQRELPDVGSRVRLIVDSPDHRKLQVVTEVLRLERNAGHPLAALQLLDAMDEWRGLVWEASAPRYDSNGILEGSDLEDDVDDHLTH